MWAARTLAVAGDDLTLVGYAALALGVVAAAASAILATGSRVRRSGTDRDRVVADVRATISELAEPAERAAVPPQLAQWEHHAAEVARRELDLYLRYSAQALRQSTTSFILGMTAASLGFIAILGSLAWLLASDRDIGWLGVISGGICEAVALLFFREVRATRARTAAILERAQAEADRVVRARSAMAVVQSIHDPRTREELLADIGRSVLGDNPGRQP